MSEIIDNEIDMLDQYARIEAIVTNMQTAEYKGDTNLHDKFQLDYSSIIKNAQEQKLDPKKTDLAETRGRLKAAIEASQENDIVFFSQQLEEKLK